VNQQKRRAFTSQLSESPKRPPLSAWRAIWGAGGRELQHAARAAPRRASGSTRRPLRRHQDGRGGTSVGFACVRGTCSAAAGCCWRLPPRAAPRPPPLRSRARPARRAARRCARRWARCTARQAAPTGQTTPAGLLRRRASRLRRTTAPSTASRVTAPATWCHCACSGARGRRLPCRLFAVGLRLLRPDARATERQPSRLTRGSATHARACALPPHARSALAANQLVGAVPVALGNLTALQALCAPPLRQPTRRPTRACQEGSRARARRQRSASRQLPQA
jgi:hypothetical protein